MIPDSYTGSAENEYCDVSCGVYLTLIAFAEGTVVFVKETIFGWLSPTFAYLNLKSEVPSANIYSLV